MSTISTVYNEKSMSGEFKTHRIYLAEGRKGKQCLIYLTNVSRTKKEIENLRRPMIAHISIRWLNWLLYNPFFFFFWQSQLILFSMFSIPLKIISNLKNKKIEVHFSLVENSHLSEDVIFFLFLFSRNSLLQQRQICRRCLWKRGYLKPQTELMSANIPWLINKYLKLRII